MNSLCLRYCRQTWVLIGLWSCLLSAGVFAAEDNSQTFGIYTVHYSTFNSLFVPAEVAKIHGIVRAKDQTLINIAIKETATNRAVAAEVTATAKNLMQQSKTVSFKTITEADAVYYIGALRHTNEEVFHLDFKILPEGANQPIEFRLTRKLYTEL